MNIKTKEGLSMITLDKKLATILLNSRKIEKIDIYQFYQNRYSQFKSNSIDFNTFKKFFYTLLKLKLVTIEPKYKKTFTWLISKQIVCQIILNF